MRINIAIYDLIGVQLDVLSHIALRLSCRTNRLGTSGRLLSTKQAMVFRKVDARPET